MALALARECEMEHMPQIRAARIGAISMESPLNITSKNLGVSTTAQVHSASFPSSILILISPCPSTRHRCLISMFNDFTVLTVIV